MEVIEPDFRDLVADYLNGAVGDEFVMVKLGVQVIAILIIGIVLWRISAIFNKKKERGRKTVFMNSKYQEKWKSRQ